MFARIKHIDKKFKLVSIVIFVIIFDLLSLYYIKYKNQGLPLHDFSLTYTGNLLNLLFSLALIIGIIFYSFGKKNTYNPGVLIFYTLLMTSSLFLAEFYTWLKIPVPDIFVLKHSLKDVLKGILFTAYQFIVFFYISVVWITFLGRKELVILRAVINSVIIAIFLLIIAIFHLKSGNEKEIDKSFTAGKKFVGVVMGAAVWSNNRPSPSLALRADMAAELYKDGILKKIQVTGGHAPGELSEAEVASAYLKSKGIDSTDIWIEKKTASTSEQIRFIKNTLINKKHLSNIIIISDPYHLARIKEICKFYKIKTQLAPSEMHLSFDSKVYYRLRESIALLVFWFFAL